MFKMAFFDLEAELTARGSDIVALFTAQGGQRPGLAHGREEGILPTFFRALPAESLNGIVGNKVDLCVEPPDQTGQQYRLLRHVIHIADQNILKGDPLLFLADVLLTGVQEFSERMLFIYRHDPVADVICRAVKGNGEAHLQRLVGEAQDLRNKPRR